jgi:hypothetical protein
MRAIAYCASALALMALAAPAAADTVPFVDTTPGSTTFTAPEAGVYDILAFGAQGGNSGGDGGLGAEVGGDFKLTAGEVLSIVVGVDGNGPQEFGFTGNGGGGTLVLTSTGTALLVAGGGGGASDEFDGGPGLASGGGGGGDGGGAFGGPGGNGGVDGSGGGAGDPPDGAGGGGGLNSAGGGALGGAPGGGGGFGVNNGPIGFNFGGGGGGFSGGGGGGGVDGVDAGGGGGGSLNTAFANLIGFDGVQSGNGEVEIDFVGPAVPEPSTWAMLLLGFAGLGTLAYRPNRSGSRPTVRGGG